MSTASLNRRRAFLRLPLWARREMMRAQEEREHWAMLVNECLTTCSVPEDIKLRAYHHQRIIAGKTR